MKRLSLPLLVLLTLAACNIPTATPMIADVPLATPPSLPVVPAPNLLWFEMVDAQNGWAAAETSLLRTSDGGQSWYDATPSGVTAVGETASIYVYDDSHAWLILPASDFNTGTLYISSDGGSTWTNIAVPFGGAWMQFFDLQTGIAFAALGAGAGSEAVALYSTTNGGAGWTRIYINDPTVAGSSDTLPLSGQKAALDFRTSTDGYVGGNIPMTDVFYLYETQDGGVTWFQRSPPWPADRTGYFAGVEQIEFVSEEEGYIVVSLVGDFMENYIYQTTNGGVTWTQIAGMIPLSHFFTLLPGPVIFCWSPNGTIYSTLDGDIGEEVTPNLAFGDALHDMQFVDGENGFALTFDWNTGDSAFYATHDAGATWTTLIP